MMRARPYSMFWLVLILLLAAAINHADVIYRGASAVAAGVATDLACAVAGCVDATDLGDNAVDTNAIQDNAVTSAKVNLNYALGDAEGGAATSGDSATGFFSSGTIESARLPADDDVPEGADLTNAPKGIRFTIEAPGAAENIIAGITDKAITVTSVSSVCLGTTPSVTWQFAHGTDLTSAADLFTADKTTTSVTTIEVDNSTFNDATIAAGEAILFQTAAASGTILNCNFTIFFTVD